MGERGQRAELHGRGRGRGGRHRGHDRAGWDGGGCVRGVDGAEERVECGGFDGGDVGGAGGRVGFVRGGGYIPGWCWFVGAGLSVLVWRWCFGGGVLAVVPCLPCLVSAALLVLPC